MSIVDLQKQMAEAISKNDVAGMEAIAAQIVAGKRDRAKVEAERLQKESEALAGKREALAARIHARVQELGLDSQLKEVKGWGFAYKVDKANPAEPDITYKSVSLTTAVVKAPRAGGGGGGAGKSKDEYGMSLGDIFDKFATDDDKAKLAAATTGSSQWQVKVAVKKQAIAAGKLAPVK